MSSYLPEKIFAVCSSQTDSEVKQFLTNKDLRSQTTVIMKSGDHPLLIMLDRKINTPCACKTKWSSGVGTIAFGAGVLAGLAVAAAVAVVPVIGWIVGGAIALGCLAYGLFQLLATPTCNDMLKYDESHWIQSHPTVYFDFLNSQKKNHNALTKKSMLMCKEGGVLIPYHNKDLAQSAADQIASNNKMEVGLVGAISFIFGGAVGFSMGTAGAATGFMKMLFVGGKEIGIGILAGYLAAPIFDKEKEIYQSAAKSDDNPLYDDLNENKTASEWTFDSADDAYDNPYKTTKEFFVNLEERTQNKEQKAKIGEALKTGEKTGTFGKDNKSAQEVLKDVKSGKYGDKAKEIFTNKSGNSRGKNTESSHSKLAESKQADIKLNTGNAGMKAAGIVGLVLPFIATGFSENAYRVITKYASQELSEGISIVAKEN